ncbi:MAG: hypothetical protein AAF483_30910, partial [Planctomycetota bacterium]
MNRLSACIYIAVFLGCNSLVNAQEASASVSGIQIVQRGIGKGYEGLFPFNTQGTGTELAILVESPKARILNLDVQNSKIEAFIDSTRKSLMAKNPDQFSQEDGFGPFPSVSQDRKAAIVSVKGSLTPGSSDQQ